MPVDIDHRRLAARRSRMQAWLIPAILTLIAGIGLLAATDAKTSPRPLTDSALTAEDIAWLKRDSFGIDSNELAQYRQLGRKAFLDAQLADRGDTLPPAISSLIGSYEAISTPVTQLAIQYRDAAQEIKSMADGDPKIAAKKARRIQARQLAVQAQQAELLHAVYGGNQLKEQMVWFWLNHFSVYAAKGGVSIMAADYEENVIRPHALGKFRDLVVATLKSPAMLLFLDNAKNVKDKTNENYARELMELHTLGVGAGYTQQDVQQLALILTGAGMAGRGGDGGFFRQRANVERDGLFAFHPDKHDFSRKVFLGHTISGSGADEIDQAIDLIVKQPACAQFVSRQLASYFVADNPPQALVDAMAKTFQRTDGNIADVLRTMFLSPELTANAGKKFKDPTQFMVSSMRLAYDGQPVTNAMPMVNWLRQMGEPVYGRITPDGWPLDSTSWSGSGQMAKRFDVARAIGSGHNLLFAASGAITPDAMPAQIAPPKLDNAIYRETIEPTLSPAARTALSKAASPVEWNTFLLSSPDFNYR